MDSSTRYSAVYSKMPWKLPAEGTGTAIVQRGNLLGQDNSVFFSKLPQKLPAYDTPPTPISHQKKLLRYDIQASPASYPGKASPASYPGQTSKTSYPVSLDTSLEGIR